ncbi:hypothetical protein CK203_076498 [Vitis vinifera]|uniref:Uncharacterized protein n=1 Tax=Vitis vinifera TaxID=29760 RepID=A0A438DB24_VITVI|nr:hypothetical protein CK203_076498 [Vitis vinifera]
MEPMNNSTFNENVGAYYLPYRFSCYSVKPMTAKLVEPQVQWKIVLEKLCNCSNSLWERTIDGVGVLVGHRHRFQCDVGGKPQGATTIRGWGWGWGWLLKVGRQKEPGTLQLQQLTVERTINGISVLVGLRRRFRRDVGGEPQGAAAVGGWGVGGGC